VVKGGEGWLGSLDNDTKDDGDKDDGATTTQTKTMTATTQRKTATHVAQEGGVLRQRKGRNSSHFILLCMLMDGQSPSATLLGGRGLLLGGLKCPLFQGKLSTLVVRQYNFVHRLLFLINYFPLQANKSRPVTY
jgi:hypothetical protein